MATALQVAATRVAVAIAVVSDRLKIIGIDSECVVTGSPANALDGTFADLAIVDSQMEFFRQILAKDCPEIRTVIMDRDNFPLAAGMSIDAVVERVQAELLNSPNWAGECMPNA